MRLKAYSELTDDVVDLGVPGNDLEVLTDLGETMATNRDGFIVFVEGLQKWETFDD